MKRAPIIHWADPNLISPPPEICERYCSHCDAVTEMECLRCSNQICETCHSMDRGLCPQCETVDWEEFDEDIEDKVFSVDFTLK